MKRRHRIDTPEHRQTRNALRTIGPVVLGIGVIFTLIGLGSFFMAFGGSGPPRLFWCAFIGLPMVGLGLTITKFGYLGAIGRYVAGEASPVAKDTFNYMADGTKDSVRDLAGAVGDGLFDRNGSDQRAGPVHCPRCDQPNEPDAQFCDQCGAELFTDKRCPECGESCDPEARFCDHCGKKLDPI